MPNAMDPFFNHHHQQHQHQHHQQQEEEEEEEESLKDHSQRPEQQQEKEAKRRTSSKSPGANSRHSSKSQSKSKSKSKKRGTSRDLRSASTSSSSSSHLKRSSSLPLPLSSHWKKKVNGSSNSNHSSREDDGDDDDDDDDADDDDDDDDDYDDDDDDNRDDNDGDGDANENENENNEKNGRGPKIRLRSGSNSKSKSSHQNQNQNHQKSKSKSNKSKSKSSQHNNKKKKRGGGGNSKTKKSSSRHNHNHKEFADDDDDDDDSVESSYDGDSSDCSSNNNSNSEDDDRTADMNFSSGEQQQQKAPQTPKSKVPSLSAMARASPQTPDSLPGTLSNSNSNSNSTSTSNSNSNSNAGNIIKSSSSRKIKFISSKKKKESTHLLLVTQSEHSTSSSVRTKESESTSGAGFQVLPVATAANGKQQNISTWEMRQRFSREFPKEPIPSDNILRQLYRADKIATYERQERFRSENPGEPVPSDDVLKKFYHVKQLTAMTTGVAPTTNTNTNTTTNTTTTTNGETTFTTTTMAAPEPPPPILEITATSSPVFTHPHPSFPIADISSTSSSIIQPAVVVRPLRREHLLTRQDSDSNLSFATEATWEPMKSAPVTINKKDDGLGFAAMLAVQEEGDKEEEENDEDEIIKFDNNNNNNNNKNSWQQQQQANFQQKSLDFAPSSSREMSAVNTANNNNWASTSTGFNGPTILLADPNNNNDRAKTPSQTSNERFSSKNTPSEVDWTDDFPTSPFTAEQASSSPSKKKQTLFASSPGKQIYSPTITSPGNVKQQRRENNRKNKQPEKKLSSECAEVARRRSSIDFFELPSDHLSEEPNKMKQVSASHLLQGVSTQASEDQGPDPLKVFNDSFNSLNSMEEVKQSEGRGAFADKTTNAKDETKKQRERGKKQGGESWDAFGTTKEVKKEKSTRKSRRTLDVDSNKSGHAKPKPKDKGKKLKSKKSKKSREDTADDADSNDDYPVVGKSQRMPHRTLDVVDVGNSGHNRNRSKTRDKANRRSSKDIVEFAKSIHGDNAAFKSEASQRNLRRTSGVGKSSHDDVFQVDSNSGNGDPFKSEASQRKSRRTLDASGQEIMNHNTTSFGEFDAFDSQGKQRGVNRIKSESVSRTARSNKNLPQRSRSADTDFDVSFHGEVLFQSGEGALSKPFAAFGDQVAADEGLGFDAFQKSEPTRGVARAKSDSVNASARDRIRDRQHVAESASNETDLFDHFGDGDGGNLLGGSQQESGWNETAAGNESMALALQPSKRERRRARSVDKVRASSSEDQEVSDMAGQRRMPKIGAPTTPSYRTKRGMTAAAIATPSRGRSNGKASDSWMAEVPGMLMQLEADVELDIGYSEAISPLTIASKKAVRPMISRRRGFM